MTDSGIDDINHFLCFWRFLLRNCYRLISDSCDDLVFWNSFIEKINSIFDGFLLENLKHLCDIFRIDHLIGIKELYSFSEFKSELLGNLLIFWRWLIRLNSTIWFFLCSQEYFMCYGAFS